MTKNKDKERILKAARENPQITYMGIPIRLSADFSAETLQVRREWHNIFRVIKGENLQPEYSARLSFRLDGEIKNFTNLAKVKSLYHQTSFITNIKGTSLGEKEKAITRNKIITKKFIIKANI